MAERANPILEQVNQQSMIARSLSVDLGFTEQSNARKAETIYGEIERDQTKIGTNLQIQAQAKLTAEMEAQQIANKAIQAAGGYDTLFRLVERRGRVANEVLNTVQEVRKDQETRLVDDPITWIKTQVDWDGKQKKLAGAVEELSTLHNVTNTLVQDLSQIGQVSRASAQTITQAAIQASTDNIALTAAQQARAARLEGLKQDTAQIQALAGMEERELTYLTNGLNADRQERQFQLALESEQERRADRQERIDLAREAKEEKLDERRMSDKAVEYINLQEKFLGRQPSSALEIRDHIKLNKGLGPEYAELYENGKLLDKGGPGIISTSPAKVAAMFVRDETLLSGLTDEQQDVAKILLEARKVLGKPENKLAITDDKTGKIASGIVEAEINRVLTTQLSYIGNNADNLFYLGEPASYLGSKENPGVAAFQSLPLVQKVIQPLIDSGVSMADPNIPFNAMMYAVKRGELNSSQAASDFASMYRRMFALKKAGLGFKKFAIALPDGASKYNAKIGGNVYDLTNPQDINTAIVRNLARGMTSNSVFKTQGAATFRSP